MNDSGDICARLEKVERSNRRLRGVLALCICCTFVAVLLGAASPVPNVVEAQKFILRDDAGNERGELFVSDKSTGLLLLNKDGTHAGMLAVGSQTNALMLWDHNGNLRQAVSSDLDESAWNVFRPGSEAAQFSFSDNGKGTTLVKSSENAFPLSDIPSHPSASTPPSPSFGRKH